MPVASKKRWCVSCVLALMNTKPGRSLVGVKHHDLGVRLGVT